VRCRAGVTGEGCDRKAPRVRAPAPVGGRSRELPMAPTHMGAWSNGSTRRPQYPHMNGQWLPPLPRVWVVPWPIERFRTGRPGTPSGSPRHQRQPLDSRRFQLNRSQRSGSGAPFPFVNERGGHHPTPIVLWNGGADPAPPRNERGAGSLGAAGRSGMPGLRIEGVCRHHRCGGLYNLSG
jgi:hypothetical protein